MAAVYTGLCHASLAAVATEGLPTFVSVAAPLGMFTGGLADESNKISLTEECSALAAKDKGQILFWSARHFE